MTGQFSSGGNAHSVVETRAFLSRCHCRSLVCEMATLLRQSVCRSAAETHSIGKSILAQADANPWQAALDYAMVSIPRGMESGGAG